jgi:hypothetical protein
MNIRLRFLSASGLETAIINKLEHFLLEPGKGFLLDIRQNGMGRGGGHAMKAECLLQLETPCRLHP